MKILHVTNSIYNNKYSKNTNGTGTNRSALFVAAPDSLEISFSSRKESKKARKVRNPINLSRLNLIEAVQNRRENVLRKRQLKQ